MTLAQNSPQVHHHHWLAFWKPLAFVALLVVLGIGGALFWPPLAVVCFISALIIAASIYAFWSWHTLTFTDDNRLIRRRGFLGWTEDLTSLFGVITPQYTPVVGRWLDVGDVSLSVPGPDSHIRYIANFESFRRQLIQGAQQQQNAHNHSPVAVIIQLPPPQRGDDDSRDLLFPRPTEPVLTYPDVAVQRDGQRVVRR